MYILFKYLQGLGYAISGIRFPQTLIEFTQCDYEHDSMHPIKHLYPLASFIALPAHIKESEDLPIHVESLLDNSVCSRTRK